MRTVKTSITHLIAEGQDMNHNSDDQADAATTDRPDATEGVPDPRDTDHPAGEAHAKRNQENEPVA